MMLQIDVHRWFQNGHQNTKIRRFGRNLVWFAMAAILNPKWPPKSKNPPIWTKFGFQLDSDATN